MTKPSLFAVSRSYKGKMIVDFGCGEDGRDTIYFNKTGNHAIGIDLIAPLDKNFEREDVSVFMRKNLDTKYDVLYARFFIHRITDSLETSIINWSYWHANELAIEARAEGDVPILFPDHWRRMINPGKLLNKVIRAGYKKIEVSYGHGKAKYKGEDPLIVRIIAKK